MTNLVSKSLGVAGPLIYLLCSALHVQAGPPSLQSLLPQMAKWEFSESPQAYFPESLFEYIDGAAENYLSYDFQELVVAQYKNKESGASLTLEIYDMGRGKNAFGIYSAERYPESRFLSLGNQGYLEEGSLNFVIADKYVKLLCFDCGDKAEDILMLFAQEVEKKVGEKGGLPLSLGLFPREGLIPNSERFILRNFLGFSFLHDGYLASYRQEDQEFDLILVEAMSDQEAEEMLEKYLESHAKASQAPRVLPLGFHIKDRYALNVYVARVKNHIIGVMKIRDGFEENGLKYLRAFAKALEK